MDKDHLKKLAQNPNFISGIYNYCDRWCERCTFTSRCMNFALSEEQFSDPESQDINNDLFWQKLSETFQLTLEMVKEAAEEYGIDLNSLDLEAAEKEDRLKDEIAEKHECSRLAKKYGKMVRTWFDSAGDLFKEKEENLNLQVQLEMPNANPIAEADSIKDAVDVIHWYQHFIYVKLMRAIRGNLDEFSEDSDGSAKVALIAIDRSIAAWGEMHSHFPEQKDEILDTLIHLDRLRRKVEKEFPKARAFVRPGFDEIER